MVFVTRPGNAHGVSAHASERPSGIITPDELTRVDAAVRDHVAQLQALYELTDKLVRADGLPAIYEAALDALTSATGCDRAAVLLFDHDGVMRFQASRGLSAAYRAAVEGHSPWSRDDAAPLPMTVEDASRDESLAEFRALIVGEGIHALAFIPLVYSGALLGKFMLYCDAPHAFTTSELRIAETVARHVTIAVARRRDEDRLRVYRKIFENSTDGIAIINSDGRYLEQNAAHGEMLGYDAADLRDATPAIHLGDEAFAKIAAELAAHGRCRARVVSRAKDGTRYDLDLSAFAVADDSGSTTFVGMKRNVTEEEAARRRTEQLAAELRRALEVRQEFLSIASHELKTPVTAIALQLDTLIRAATRSTEPLSSDALNKRLGSAKRDLVKLVGLIDALLDLSRIDAGRLALQVDRIDFADVFRAAAERFRDELGRAGCAFTVRVDGPIDGASDAQRLEQIVTNLLSNAAKYGAGAPVEASIEADERAVRIRVRDSGIGIAEADRARIFERFERAVSDRRYGGFGLGLFIAREIVTALGGTISVESTPGAGSTFTIEVPRNR